MIPNRLPGDPPWLWTVPPARFVAVRIDPTPVFNCQGVVDVLEGSEIESPSREKGLLVALTQRDKKDIVEGGCIVSNNYHSRDPRLSPAITYINFCKPFCDLTVLPLLSIPHLYNGRPCYF